ncbi:phospholipase A [Psychroflexus sp. YR1-1]|uniref:Phosphatidylcholine 1-acylhydrolase n=1 Tax=Psychroflexus aurantiacus TaxID=2709310 RepID=A0A6B3QZ17_9FLAO|nr:phospholipase A [Psychroflexus aurantiacus]NEV93419.1 phospholipase A [Psychroflexus aurantiacus]
MKIEYLILFLFFTMNSYSQSVFGDDQIIEKTMSQRWELDEEDKNGTFKLTFYKPIYVLPVRWSNDPNVLPQSSNPQNSFEEPLNYDQVEAKFQLSLKTKLIQSFLFGYGDIWLAYTQLANWQVYNDPISRPFRELNYEPEIIVNFPVNVNVFGIDLKMAGLAFNHKSNGRDLPRSRSWNRLIFHVAFEKDNFQLYLKPWIRLESSDKDDNPLISDYVGRMEAEMLYNLDRHSIHVIGRNSLDSEHNRGSLEINYMYSVKSNLRLHVQAFTGYGETLIDYNHKQTTLGLGISFIDW